MSGPLSGVRILDLTSVIMGPYATQLLGDYGADVIKVEAPDGDVMRKSGPMRNPDMGHFYLTTNRNKRSVVMDLKRPEGREALLRIVATCDALIYNVRPQAMARLGLSYEDVKVANPEIIYAGAFGFSQRGPYAARPAYDDLIQGMCGIPWLSSEASGDKPRYAPIVLVDRMAGLQLASAVTSALFYRSRTGKGQRVDVPMFEGMVSTVLGEHLAGHLYRPPIAPPGYQRSLAHDRRPLETRDGHICVMVYNDKQWRSFFELIGQEHVFASDERFQTQGARLANIDHVYGFLSATIKTRTTDEWLSSFARADIPAARMFDIDDILADEHLAEIGYFRSVMHPSEGEMLQVAIPTEWSESIPEQRRHAPLPGEHTKEVLRDVGYSEQAVAALEEMRVVASWRQG